MTYSSLQLNGPVGQPLVRASGHEKVTGSATFTAEWSVDDLLHVVAVPSTVARGRIKTIDTSEAESIPKVVGFVLPDNVPSFNRFKSGSETNFATSIASALYPAAENEAFFSGQFVAGCIAESFESARDGALAVKVDYEIKPHTTDIDDADQFQQPKKLMEAPPVLTIGDAEAVLGQCDVVVDHDYPTAMNHHNPIEPHATIAHWTTENGKPFLTVYDTSQGLNVSQMTYAKVFGLDPKQVRVVCKYIGGAFGSKGLMWPQSLLACFAAKLTGRPVKCVMTRRQMYGGTGHRTPVRQRFAIGATADGNIRSVIHEGYAATSIEDIYVESFTMASRMMIGTETLRLAQKQCRLNTQIPTFMRAPAETPGMFALESAIDELAVKLDIDPIELRRINEPEIDIHKDKPFSSRLLIQCLDEGSKAFGWSNRNPKPRSQTDGHWLVGQGVASATYPYFTYPTQVDLVVGAGGKVSIRCCTHEMGTGTRTAQTQLLADLLDVPASRVSMELGDTKLPRGAISGGSATTASVGGAIRDATENLKDKLLSLVADESPLSGLTSDQVRFKSGDLVGPRGRESMAKILASAMKDSVRVSGQFKTTKSETSDHSFGATFVEVGVDESFGVVRVRRMLGCYACGTILNAKTGRSQFLGGLIFGVGHALQEITHWDHRVGRITNDNLAEYHVPVNADIPDVDIMWIDTPDYDASPIGAKGIGEIGITGVAAAIANAVYHATGRRIRSLPITPEKVMA